MIKLYKISFAVSSFLSFLSFDSSIILSALSEKEARMKAKEEFRKSKLEENSHIMIFSIREV